MKFLIVFAMALATVSARDLYSRSIEVPVSENEDRIINGKNAAPGQFKYMAGLSLEIGTKLEWCSGSLIDKNWVLTAAHCTYSASAITVYLGTTQRKSAEKVYNASKSDIVIHPDFDPDTYDNDISLIRIPTTSESSKIGIIGIPCDNNNKYVGESAVISGWGQTSDTVHSMNENLQYGILKVSPASDCLKVYKSGYIEAMDICVATPDKVSPCYGDSGDPLVLEGQYLQIGFASYGAGAGCSKGYPVAFTRVSAYIPWIKSHIKIAY